MADISRKLYGVQFHPEVHHTPRGRDLLHNFLYRVCGASGTWEMASFIDETIQAIRQQVGEANVVLGLSGGVDSSVVALLLHRAIGRQLHAIFVDNGVCRKDEAHTVAQRYRDHFDINLTCVDASERFLSKLAGVEDPETKRHIIGHEFVAVFKDASAHIPDMRFLAQGTLYPDVIESVSAHGGPTSVIKSHHNVGGLPAKLGLDLVEPLRDLFKDEVRAIGQKLGMPDELVWRHPFPGPGLAVRILGEVTRERVRMLQEADVIIVDEIRRAGYYRKMWQGFGILLPIRSVGVMGDERTYEHVLALRCVDSVDGMTADWVHLPYALLGQISNRIINTVRGVNRVVYDISQKPPATIEWE